MRTTTISLVVAVFCAVNLVSSSPVPARTRSQVNFDHHDSQAQLSLFPRAPRWLPEMSTDQALTLGGAVAGVVGLSLYEIASSLGTKANANSFKANMNMYLDRKRKADEAQRALLQAKQAKYEAERQETARAMGALKKAHEKMRRQPGKPKHTEETGQEPSAQDQNDSLQRRGKSDLLQTEVTAGKAFGNAADSAVSGTIGTKLYVPSVKDNLASERLVKTPEGTQAKKTPAKKSRYDSNNAIWAAIAGGWVALMGVHAITNASFSYDLSKRLDMTKVHGRRSTNDDVPLLLRREIDTAPSVIFIPNA